MSALSTLAIRDWGAEIAPSVQGLAIKALERGQLLFLPQLPFVMRDTEQCLLTPQLASARRKNISYYAPQHRLTGMAQTVSPSEVQHLQQLLARFAHMAHILISQLFPSYRRYLLVGRTSFRPVEVSHRPMSPRKDDRRLHVDAFPATPNHGKRILRVFSNVNPNGADRIWRLGEAFEAVVAQFLPQLRSPVPGVSGLLKCLGMTKSRRSRYDHYMLQLHNTMKEDDDYQTHVSQQAVHFPPQTTWIVQTDHVSHAALHGQYVLEQTFYLPVTAMQSPEYSPLRVLEQALQRRLV